MLFGGSEEGPGRAEVSDAVEGLVSVCSEADAQRFPAHEMNAAVGEAAGKLVGVDRLRSLWRAEEQGDVAVGGLPRVPVIGIDISHPASADDGGSTLPESADGRGAAAGADMDELRLAELVRIVSLQALIARGIAGASHELHLRTRSLRSILGLLDQVSRRACAAVVRVGGTLTPAYPVCGATQITDLEGQIRDFQKRSSDKSRFKGSSLVFLQEEKFRRSASTQCVHPSLCVCTASLAHTRAWVLSACPRYPRLLRRLHREVCAWEESEEQPFVVAGVHLRPKLAELISVRASLPAKRRRCAVATRPSPYLRAMHRPVCACVM